MNGKALSNLTFRQRPCAYNKMNNIVCDFIYVYAEIKMTKNCMKNDTFRRTLMRLKRKHLFSTILVPKVANSIFMNKYNCTNYFS